MEKQNKFAMWMKRYGSYAVAGVFVAVLAVTVLVVGLNSNTTQNAETSNVDKPVISVNTIPLTYSMPMQNATLVKDFSSNELYLNQTLGRWEFHGGIDLTSDNLSVFSVARGTVSSITTDSLNGTTITINHGNNLESIYSSLNSNVLVKVGDSVSEGQKIGEADSTAGHEESDGKHLHFEMLENNKKIDPANYLEFELK